MNDPVNHPTHYTTHPSGVECIDVIEHMNLCRGNVIKYVWRAGLKGDEIEDLRKARFYLDREVARLERANERPTVSRRPSRRPSRRLIPFAAGGVCGTLLALLIWRLLT